MAAVHVAPSSSTSATKHPKSTSFAPNKSSRTPLLPSCSHNAPCRPKGSKVVTSRYLATGSSSSGTSSPAGVSSTKRCPSTSTAVLRAVAGTPLVRRSQSAERRTGTPRPGMTIARDSADGRVSSAQRTLVSARSLSVSFQGDSYSVPVDKVKATVAEKPNPALAVRPMSGSGDRKGTPERRRIGMLATPRASADNLKALMEQKHRWPGRSAMSRSVDLGGRSTLSQGSVVRDLGNSMIAIDVRGSCDERNDNTDLKQDAGLRREGNCDNNGSLGIGRSRINSGDCVESDSESALSGSISTAKESNVHVPGALNSTGGAVHGIRGVMVQARFSQELSSQLAQPPSPMAAVAKLSSTSKIILAKRPGSDSPLSSPKGSVNSRGQASPSRGAVRPASPSKLSSLSLPSLMRGPSPSRMRGGSDNSMISTPSMLSFAGEARRGKVGESRIFYAHALKLLHNRLLQWRFVNARADYSLFVQALNAERSLYNSWAKISKLRESVKAQALQFQMLRHILKLSSVLNGQMVHLEKWASMDGDYSSSLSGATEALHASHLRLPVIGGARVSVQNLKNAMASALEMLQVMATSLCINSSKVGGVQRLVTELADVTLQERALLVQCRDLLSSNAAMQINECSLRAHILQRSDVSSIG